MSESSSSQQDSFPDWAAPIAACIRSFKGGTLIVHSAPFRDALVEAERIWVEENIDYKTEEDKYQNTGRGNRNSEEQIIELESAIERLTLEKRELEREIGTRTPPAARPLKDPTARPEDVAELLSDIYNTEWQNAADFFMYKKKFREREAAGELLKILQDCFEFCGSLSEEHLKNLLDEVFVPTENHHLLKKIHIPPPADLTSKHVASDLNKIRRFTYPHMVPVVEQLFFLSEKHHLKTHIKTEKLYPFIKLCLKCAWISCVQDRPLSFTFNVRSGSSFYPDVMISRNTPAPEVDYLVWPILFLHDNGPLLLKGIVHCSQLK
nr:uncharacterized protein LOC111123785 isoform X2 [Crassostrea virginica]